MGKDCIPILKIKIMVTLDSFIQEELNDHARGVILSALREGKHSNKEKDQLVFNKYSLDILFSENQVIIYDDVFPEDEPLEIGLDDFISSISKE